ncbi:MAG: transposase, partial [Eggerthellaceae bacterium]|nr:transposase [Eggerthellaceae bacterium]
ILNYFENRVTNAILEGINSVVQNVKRRARGYRNNEYFKAMSFWH